jgi:hypothetical protein
MSCYVSPAIHWVSGKDKKNRAHHVQSGLICDATAIAVSTSGGVRVFVLPLQSVSIVASSRPRGDDVACNYGLSKAPLVVVEAIRVNKGEHADDVFDDMRTLLASKYDRFHHVSLPVPLTHDAPAELGRDMKYNHFEATLDGKKYLATIWVGVVRGWAVVVYAVGIGDNIFAQHAAVNTRWVAAAQSVVAASNARGEQAP